MKSKILGLLAVALLAGPMPANAITITTSSNGTWDVSVAFIIPTDSVALLQSQIWWGNQALATQFAMLVGTNLGLPINSGFAGPLFAYEFFLESNNAQAWVPMYDFVLTGTTLNDARSYYAVATRVPEPGTLALLGLGLAALGLRRRRRAD